MSETNGLGMLIRERTSSPTEAWRSVTYDSAGRRVSEKLGSETLATYSYPDSQTTESKQFATPDPARTHSQTQSYVKQGNAWWRVSTSDGAAQWEKLRLGFGEMSQTRTIDADGRESTSQTDNLFGGVTRTTSTSPGISAPTISTSLGGLLVRSEEPGGNITTTTYDGFGRPLETVASEAGLHTTFTYDPVTGQVGTQQSWATYAQATDSTTTVNTYYAKTEATPGRLKTRSVDGVVTNFAYTPRGELLAQWGATYPVKYDYDAAGRMWKLTTYRTNDPGSYPPAMWPTGDVTEWTYHPGTELLLKKEGCRGEGDGLWLRRRRTNEYPRLGADCGRTTFDDHLHL